MAKGHTTRHGSMAYYPRKRARSIIARVRRWVDIGEAKLLGFAGYKVGVLHVVRIDDNPNSPFYGQEIAKVATVIETPPIRIVGVRVYEKSYYGLRSMGEVWVSDLPPDLKRVFTVPKRRGYHEEQLKKIEEIKDSVDEVRAIVAMQPRKAGIHKKKPEVFEIGVGGDTSGALEYALDRLGKEVTLDQIFSEGDYIDVISITKGKGFQGVIKRFGVKEMPRWHKHRKGHRRIGSVGPTKPAIMFTTPFPGQMGFHQRTEYNKRILKIGNLMVEDEERRRDDEINPPGGWPRYGLVRSMYVLVEGTLPGPPKRLVKMRFPARPPTHKLEKPRIVYISTRPFVAARLSR